MRHADKENVTAPAISVSESTATSIPNETPQVERMSWYNGLGITLNRWADLADPLPHHHRHLRMLRGIKRAADSEPACPEKATGWPPHREEALICQ